MDIETVKVKLPLENAPEYANVYVVDSFMVDGGFISKQHAEELFEKTKVENVVITHHHLDHVGIVFWKLVNAYLHEREINFLEMYYKPQKFVKPYLDWMNKYGIDFKFVKPLAEAIAFKEGKKEKIKVRAKINNLKDKIFGFNVILTPGHSPGHICLYKDKILFSGDLILSDTTTHVGYYPGYSRDPMGDQIKSLEMLLKIEIDVVYPAHERIIKNPEKRIRELIDHYKERIEEVYTILEEKPMGVVEIASRVTWHRDFDKLRGWDKLLAIGETLACLKYLKNVGRIEEVEEEFIKFKIA